MNISGWSIDGCGLLHDYEIRELSNQLTVIVGPNEAGKTTLLDFIRAMLFTTKANEAPPKPLYGGAHGGRLSVTGSDGASWTIHREFGKNGFFRLQAADGSIGSQADLDRLLGNCDQKVFRSVFAFSLTELRAFDVGPKDEINSKIFSTGIEGAGISATSAIKDLKGRQDKLLKPQLATTATLNDLARDIKEIQTRGAVARAQADGYQAALQREADCQQDVERLKSEIGNLTTARRRAEKLVDLWPVWSRRCDAEERLAALPTHDRLPLDAEGQLQIHQRSVETASQAQKRASDELIEAQHRRQKIDLNDSLARIAAETTDVHRTLAVHRNNLERTQSLDVQTTSAEHRLNEKLALVGQGWDRERLATIDVSIPHQAEIRAWDDTLTGEADAVAYAQRTHRQKNEDFVSSRAMRDDRIAAHATQPAPLGYGEIERRERAVADYRANRDDEKAAAQQTDAGQHRLDDLDRERSGAEQTALPRWSAAALGAFAFLSAVGAVWQLFAGSNILAALLGVAAALALAAAWLTWRGQTAKRHALARIDADTASAAETLSERSRARANAAGAMNSALTALALPDAATGRDVEDAAVRLTALRNGRDAYERAAAVVAECERDAIARAASAEAAATEAHAAAARQDERRLRWNAWKHDAGIPAPLAPLDVLQFFTAVHVANDAHQAVATLESETTALNAVIETYETRVHQVIASAGDTPFPDHLAGELSQLEHLHTACAADKERRTRATGLDDEIGTLTTRLETREGERTAAENAREQLFTAADVLDESGFLEAIATLKTRFEWSRAIAEANQHLVEQLGHDAAADEMRLELASGQVENWQDLKLQFDEAIALAESEREGAIAARTEAESQRRAIEGSADLATAELELASKFDALQAAHREWQVAKLAEKLIEETRAKFERERQPEVLADASHLFTRVTGDRYQRLYQRDHGFDIEPARGVLISPDCLSRGTREQLYLCLRLALASDFRRRGHQLPLVMDDVLVNFDPERAHAVAQMLCDASQQQQILLFTCHPATATMLQALHPPCGHIEMQRYGAAAPQLVSAQASL